VGFIHEQLPIWCRRGTPSLSGCVFLQVLKALWDVLDEAKQHVRGGGLDVSARFPARDRIAAEPQKTSKLSLRQSVSISDRVRA
jgi:hypothetical protein